MFKRFVTSAHLSDNYAFLVAALLAGIFFVQGFFGSLNKSLTWDEPSFISAGYAYLKWDYFQLNPSHPPLMQDLEALPLLFLDLKHPERNDPRWQNALNPVVEFGRQFIYESGNDPIQIAFWSRLPVLLMGTGLVFAIFLWGRNLYGAGPALLGTAIAAFSPNLLAHAKLATEDLGCTTLMFVAVWTFWLAINKERLQDWILCGCMTGLALLSKYTALLLGPIYLGLIGYFWLFDRTKIKLVPMIRGLAIIGCLSIFLIGAAYNFSFDYSFYLKGVTKIYTDTVSGYDYYLLGDFSTTPWFYYCIVAFLLKVPVSILILLGLSAVYGVLNNQHRKSFFFLLVPVLIIIGASFFDRHNLGLRRILPGFPFIFLFTSQVLVGEKRRSIKYLTTGLVCWTIIEALFIYPNHLSYFNVAVGGPKRGPYLLDDSNIDWGQDLPQLSTWQKLNPTARPLKLMYFGSAPPEAYGVNSRPMEDWEIIDPQPGIYAISAHYLTYFRKIMFKNQELDIDCDWLKKYKPISYAGYSIYIYQFPVNP
jgi:hypothetical protein